MPVRTALHDMLSVPGHDFNPGPAGNSRIDPSLGAAIKIRPNRATVHGPQRPSRPQSTVSRRILNRSAHAQYYRTFVRSTEHQCKHSDGRATRIQYQTPCSEPEAIRHATIRIRGRHRRKHHYDLSKAQRPKFSQYPDSRVTLITTTQDGQLVRLPV